ncbi:hypothetical protein ORV05_27000 [Amycolatopsis cynarae]|uniref:Uncharacterized protein n=1 Tax=Amycolatopsis cynarae TaxID=2995223 RepID=A0ABY7AX47_9PSEU|nr:MULTISPECIES: hypothetical protein [Amycolatopsis]WAL64585.1 hypothetical protein ORV05_27000 [Amycolatopsis sp. HUAS 11-8]
MCQRTTCSRCQKPTYRGCGRHVELVLADVPKSKRCSCASEPQARRSWWPFGRR